MSEEDFSKGTISEWNEGNFKNLRLHEAQEMINEGKVDPFKVSNDGYSWNYQKWKAGIDILYGEGASKYSSDEEQECDKTKNFVEKIIAIKPPLKNITEYGIRGRISKSIPNKENQEKIKNCLEQYEKIVKKYNDKHGLSTRNRDEEWDGL